MRNTHSKNSWMYIALFLVVLATCLYMTAGTVEGYAKSKSRKPMTRPSKQQMSSRQGGMTMVRTKRPSKSSPSSSREVSDSESEADERSGGGQNFGRRGPPAWALSKGKKLGLWRRLSPSPTIAPSFDEAAPTPRAQIETTPAGALGNGYTDIDALPATLYDDDM